MGATTFLCYVPISDPREAFLQACDEARMEYGHGGYTGTIAEKSDFVIIERDPQWTFLAERRANELLSHSDSRICDKWGPAGALAVCSENRIERVTVKARVVEEAQLRAKEVVEERLLPGEKIASVTGPSAWSSDQTDFTISVAVRKVPAGVATDLDFRVRIEGSARTPEFQRDLTEAASKKLRLGSTDVLLSVRATMIDPAGLRVDAADAVTKQTRYLVTSSRSGSRHDRFETGLRTKAEAVKYAKELLRSGLGGESASIEAVTRSSDGSALISLYSSASHSMVSGKAHVMRGVGQPDQVDGWMFFGWASI